MENPSVALSTYMCHKLVVYQQAAVLHAPATAQRPAAVSPACRRRSPATSPPSNMCRFITASMARCSAFRCRRDRRRAYASWPRTTSSTRRGQVVLAVRLQPCHVRTDRPFRLNEPQVFRLDRPTMGTEVFVGVIACPVLYTLEHFFTDTSTAPDGNVKLRCTSKKTIFFSRSACHRTYRARVKKALVVYVYGCHAIVSANHSR
jgi:hypothetical protein